MKPAHLFGLICSVDVIILVLGMLQKPVKVGIFQRRLVESEDRCVINARLQRTVTSSVSLLECVLICFHAADCDFLNYFSNSKTCQLLLHTCTANGRARFVPHCQLWGKEHSNPPTDCEEVSLHHFGADSGIYTIQPRGSSQPLQVYCDLEADDGGWTVIQRRVDDSVDFSGHWDKYRGEFGNLSSNFWFGNDNLHTITSAADLQLRVTLSDFSDEWAHAQYTTFKVANEESFYQLNISGYSGTAGDALGQNHNGMNFTTIDADHDSHELDNCAQTLSGGWWFSSCAMANLNGLYAQLNDITSVKKRGIIWAWWRGTSYSMKYADMKIKPAVCKYATT